MTFKDRVAKHLLVIKAARRFKKEIEKAGLANLKSLAEGDISIVATYLNGCSPEEKGTYRRDLNFVMQMGVTPDMILTELIKQIPDLAPIIERKPDYKKKEIQNLERFLLTTA